MAGSSDERDVTIEDLVAFAALRADGATRQRVIAAMADRQHPLSQLVRSESDVLSQQDAGNIAESGEYASAVSSVDEIIHSEFESLIGSYLAWEQSQLDDELTEFLPEQEAEIVRRSGGQVSPLKPYLDEIRRVVCQEWGWCNRRDDGALNEPVNLVIALADAFVTCRSQIPFPPTLLAVLLVKIGLDRLCRERKT